MTSSSGQKVGGVTPSIDIGAAGQTFASPSSLDAWSGPRRDDGIVAGSSVTLFAGFPKADLEFFFQALAENQYMRILANPTLVALSGEEAHFLAGGEFPIPVPQTSGRSEPVRSRSSTRNSACSCPSGPSSSATAASACTPCRKSAS